MSFSDELRSSLSFSGCWRRFSQVVGGRPAAGRRLLPSCWRPSGRRRDHVDPAPPEGARSGRVVRSASVPRRLPLLPIFLIVLVDVFGLAMIIPLLTIYAEQFGATALGATLLISIYAGCQLVSGPLLGKASDRIGRKPLLVVSQIGTFIGFL